MSGITGFTPGATVSISGTTSSSVGSGTLSADQPMMEIQNTGTTTAFVKWGVGAQTAAVTDYPILAGQTKIVSKGPATNVAGIMASGTATIYCTGGFGNR